MTKKISHSHTDTAIANATPIKVERPILNFAADFRVKKQSENEVILTNLTSPLDRPEHIRVSVQNVSNIYSNTDIDSSVYAPSKRGVSLLAQLTETISVTDDSDPDYRVDLPVSFHFVAKVPVNENIDATVIEEGFARLLSTLYETNSTAPTRINSILRGSLTPKDL